MFNKKEEKTMLSGHAQVKAKSVKYLNDGRFELVLTDVAPNDIMELLRCSGKFIHFEFGETIKTDRGFEDQPENGRLFTTDGSGVVEMEPSEEAEETAEEACSGPEGVYICDSCGLHVGELEGDDGACPECEVGKLVYHKFFNECGITDATESNDDNSTINDTSSEMTEAVNA
jgi:rubrerythrin